MRHSLAIALALAVCAGCASLKIDNKRTDGNSTTVTIRVPVMPWQDTKTIVNKLTVSAKTNWTLVGFSGEQAVEGNTNSMQMIEAVVGAAVGAAVKAAIAP